MFTITSVAQKKINELIKAEAQPVQGVAIIAREASPLQVDLKMGFIRPGQETPEDMVLHFEGFDVYTNAQSRPHLEHMVIDYTDTLMDSGFTVGRSQALPPRLSDGVAENVQAVIVEQINPALAAHGGQVGLIDIKDNVVYVEFSGGCQGCAQATATLKGGIERAIKEAMPEIAAVYDVTDHAEGKNPYYRA